MSCSTRTGFLVGNDPWTTKSHYYEQELDDCHLLPIRTTAAVHGSADLCDCEDDCAGSPLIIELPGVEATGCLDSLVDVARLDPSQGLKLVYRTCVGIAIRSHSTTVALGRPRLHNLPAGVR